MRCVNCGWINAPEAIKCEKCSSDLVSLDSILQESMSSDFLPDETRLPEKPVINRVESSLAATISDSISHSDDFDKSHKKLVVSENETILETRSQAMSNVACGFELQPIHVAGEQHAFGTLHFESNDVIICRENTERDNLTISSESHARIACADGKWTISDHTGCALTFVAVKSQYVLEDGDIILLGNRMFRFNLK